MSKLRRVPLHATPETTLLAAVETREPDYVPAGVAVRMRISPNIVTIHATLAALRALDDDDRVASVEIATALRVYS